MAYYSRTLENYGDVPFGSETLTDAWLDERPSWDLAAANTQIYQHWWKMGSRYLPCQCLSRDFNTYISGTHLDTASCNNQYVDGDLPCQFCPIARRPAHIHPFLVWPFESVRSKSPP